MKLHADAKQDAKLQATIRDWWKAVNNFLDKNYDAIEWDTYDAPKSLTLTQLKERGWGWTEKGNLVLSAEKILGEKFFMTLRPTGEKHGFLAKHKHLKAPMLIFSVLKKPFSTVGLASRVTHTIFAHEVTHYLDELRTKGHKQSSSKKFDAGDVGAYFNDPYEYNAYYQEALTTIHSLLEMEEVPLDVKRTLLGSFEKFKAQILDKLGPVLLEHLDDRFKKKLLKRLYGFWSHYKERLGSNMSFSAKVQAKYLVEVTAKGDRKSSWMAAFEDSVVALDSKHRGKIEWDSAHHFFNQGLDPKEAAEKYVANRVEATADHDEEEQEQEESEDDVYITPAGKLGSKLSLSAGGKFIGEFDEDEDVQEAIVEWMNKNKFYPNIWFVSDHGNVHPYSLDDKYQRMVK